MIRHQNDLFKEFSFPSAAPLGPGRRYPAKLRRRSPSGPRARPQNPQSAQGRGWGRTGPSSASLRLPAGPVTHDFHPFGPAGWEGAEYGDSRQPTLAYARSLCSEFSPLVPLRTPPARGPFVRCSVLPVPSLSPLPPRAPNPEQSLDGRHQSALTTAPNLEKSLRLAAWTGLLCHILQRYKDKSKKENPLKG